MDISFITSESQLLSCMEEAVRAHKREDGWSPLVKIAQDLNSKGYDKTTFGKMGLYFQKFPEIFKLYQISPTETMVTLVNSDYEVTDQPEEKSFVYDGYRSKTVKEIADISDTQFRYLSPFVADPEISSSKELTNRILKNGLLRLRREGKILYEGNFVLWNTGISSHSGCKIIGYGKIDSSGTIRIIKFVESQSGIMTKWLDRFGSMPETMDFTEIKEPFNPNYPVRLNLQHILVDRYYRFPKEYQEFLGIVCEKDTLKENVPKIEGYIKFSTMVFEGSIHKTLRQIKETSTIPVRFWNIKTDTMDWLIPVDLGVKSQSIIALVLTLRIDGDQRYYQGYTIIDLKSAYSNARLVKPILSNWLRWKE